MDPNTKKLIGALVAAALAIAVFYGLVPQQTATNIQNQANQTLGVNPAPPQTNAPSPQPQPTQTAPAPPQAPAPAAPH